MDTNRGLQSVVLLLLAGTLGASTSVAGLGDQDRSFGRHGKVVRDFGNRDDRGVDVAVQRGRKVLVLSAGEHGPAPQSSRAIVSRFLPDGRLDRSFGRSGRVAIRLPGEEAPGGIAVVRNGRILVSFTSDPNGRDVMGIAKLRPNGEPVRSFDRDGVQTVGFGPGFAGATAHDVSPAPGGDVIVVGAVRKDGSVSFDEDFAVLRLNGDGQPDESFSGDGRQTTDFDGVGDEAFAGAIESNGRIVLAGRTQREACCRDDIALARYTPAGALDPSFGIGGLARSDAADGATDVSVDHGGRVVVSGSLGDDFIAGRFTQDGEPDLSFADDGFRSVDFADGPDEANGVVVGRRRIRLTGVASTHRRGRDLGIVSLRVDGGLDRRFGNRGRRAVDVRRGADAGYAITLDGRGAVVAAGFADKRTRDQDTLVVRLQGSR